MPHTIETLTRLIASHTEPNDAECVLTALKAQDGKLITTRLLDALPGGRVEWRLTRTFGRTELHNRVSRHSSPDGIELTLAKSEASVPLDAAWIERENGRYFGARRARNAQRAAALANTAMLEALATVMNEIDALHAQLAARTATFDTFIEPDAPFYVARYELQRACGLRDIK